MSHQGRYLRGEKWFHLNRDADGNLTEGIKKDVEKMKDINVYLEANKPKEAPKETKSKRKK